MRIDILISRIEVKTMTKTISQQIREYYAKHGRPEMDTQEALDVFNRRRFMTAQTLLEELAIRDMGMRHHTGAANDQIVSTREMVMDGE